MTQKRRVYDAGVGAGSIAAIERAWAGVELREALTADHGLGHDDVPRLVAQQAEPPGQIREAYGKWTSTWEVRWSLGQSLDPTAIARRAVEWVNNWLDQNPRYGLRLTLIPVRGGERQTWTLREPLTG